MSGDESVLLDASMADDDYEDAQLRLAHASQSDGMSLRDVLRDVTAIAAKALAVDRVSIWLFLEAHRAIRCDFLYQSSAHEVFEGALLHESELPRYFRSLSEHRVVAVRDDPTDPVTSEFRDLYSRPLGITAMLDAPIYSSGEAIGIVCHEHIGPVRDWSSRERAMAVLVAETIGRLYAEDAGRRAEAVTEEYQRQIAALRRSESLGRLAAGMAHDLKNLLTAIYGFTDLIAEATAGVAAVSGLVRDIHTVTNRASNLTDQLMMLGRAEPGKPAVLDIGTHLEQYRDVLTVTVGTQIAFDIEIAPKVSRVLIDPTHLERIVLNLVVNARDATTPGGSILLRLRECAREDANTCRRADVVLEVQDTGSGIDATTLRQMFEPYFTTKGHQGTGLGLAIVQQLVTLAGGSIEVTSEVDKGTCVSIFLPRIAASA